MLLRRCRPLRNGISSLTAWSHGVNRLKLTHSNSAPAIEDVPRSGHVRLLTSVHSGQFLNNQRRSLRYGPRGAKLPESLNGTAQRFNSDSAARRAINEKLAPAENEDQIAADARGLSLASDSSSVVASPTPSFSPPSSPSSALDLTSPHHDFMSFRAYARRTGLDPASTVYTGTSYEYLTQDTLRSYGFDLHRVGGRGDRGVDLIGLWHVPHVSKVTGQWKEHTNGNGKTEVETETLRVMLQCKRMVGKRAKIGPNLVRELDGAVRSARLGALFDAVAPKEQGTAEHETRANPTSGPAIGMLVGTKPATKGVLDSMRRSTRPLVWIMMEELDIGSDASDSVNGEVASTTTSTDSVVNEHAAWTSNEVNQQSSTSTSQSTTETMSDPDTELNPSATMPAATLPVLKGRIKQILWNKAAGELGLEDVHVVQRFDASGKEEVVLMRGGRVWGGGS